VAALTVVAALLRIAGFGDSTYDMGIFFDWYHVFLVNGRWHGLGLPIGNYLSQYFANFYLTYFDHWIKEIKQVKYYYRYADDLVILSSNKPYLHSLLADIRTYLCDNLALDVKNNYQVFPVNKRGIDFVGYKFYHTHTLLRKSIKQNFARMLLRNPKPESIASYMGWLVHGNCINLKTKLLTMIEFKDLGIKNEVRGFEGEKIKIDRILNRQIKVIEYKIADSKFAKQNSDKCLQLQIEVDNLKRVVFTGSVILRDMIQKVPSDKFPFMTTIVRENERLQFT